MTVGRARNLSDTISSVNLEIGRSGSLQTNAIAALMTSSKTVNATCSFPNSSKTGKLHHREHAAVFCFNLYLVHLTGAPFVLDFGSIQHTFVNNYCRFCRTLPILLDMSFSLSLHFLPVLSLQTSVCSNLKFYPVFSGVIMSIRSFFLFCCIYGINNMRQTYPLQ